MRIVHFEVPADDWARRMTFFPLNLSVVPDRFHLRSVSFGGQARSFPSFPSFPSF
jgi:hypothetical protein